MDYMKLVQEVETSQNYIWFFWIPLSGLFLALLLFVGHKREKAEKALAEAKKALAQSETAKAEAEKAKAEAEELQSQTHSKNLDLLEQIEVMNGKLSEALQANAKAETELEKLAEQNLDLLSQIEVLKGKLAEAEKLAKNTEADNLRLKQEASELRDNLLEAQTVAANANAEKEKALIELTLLGGELGKLEDSAAIIAAESMAEKAKLEAKLAEADKALVSSQEEVTKVKDERVAKCYLIVRLDGFRSLTVDDVPDGYKAFHKTALAVCADLWEKGEKMTPKEAKAHLEALDHHKPEMPDCMKEVKKKLVRLSKA